MNLSSPEAVVGAYFPEMIAILAVIFGGAFLLFSYRHYDYFAGVTGFLLGGWMGTLIRAQYLADSRLSPLVYMGACAVAGACIAVFYRRFVGILLGGFAALIITRIIAPEVLSDSPNQNLSFALIFLMGGGLGALFPKFFYVVNTSLIGAVFVTYGVSTAFGVRLAEQLPTVHGALLHFLVFIPCLLFGILYQFVSTRDETEAVAGGNQQIVINAR